MIFYAHESYYLIKHIDIYQLPSRIVIQVNC